MGMNSYRITVYSLIQSKKNRLFIYVLLLIPFLTEFCQASTISKVDLRGIIKERDGEVVPGVMVTIKDNGNKNVTYTISNDKGIFSLSVPKELDGTIHFSCIGFKELIIPLNQFKNNADYILSEEAFQLNEITVRVPPITAKGDTLTYNVNSFRDASDRTIEDIIKKLPGVNVSDDGRIYYNGEAITKFYIEGLDLLSGRYALASRNISPDDVISVNIYENHQAKKVLKDIEYSNKAALNLKLKNKSMLRPIGYIKAGVGIDSDKDVPWTGELFGLLVSPKNQILLSAKGNNIGISYQDETKILTNSEVLGNTSIFEIYPDTPFGSAKIPTYRYYDNRSESASINSIFQIGKNSTLNINADYTDDYFSYTNDQFITYTIGNNENMEICEYTDSEPHLKEVKTKINFENNTENKYISDKLSFIGHFKLNNYEIKNNKEIEQRVKTRDFNLSNMFDGTFRVSDHVIEFKSNFQFGTTPINLLTAITDGNYIIHQNIKGYNIRNREDFGYSWLINAKSFIGFKSSFNLDYDIFQSYDKFSIEKRSNDISGYKITTTIEPLYQCKLSRNLIVNVSVPVILSNLKYHNIENNRYYPTNRFDIDLKTSINYNAPFNIKMALTIGRNSRLGNISDYIINPLYTTFRQSNVLGSGNLNNKKNRYANYNLSYRNTINGFFSSASFMFMRSNSNKLSGIDITNNEDITSLSKDIDNKSNLFNANFFVSKKIFSWNTTFSFNGSYEFLRKNIIRQNNILRMGINNYTCQFDINSNPWNNYLIMMLNVMYSYSGQKINKFDLNNNTNQTNVSISLVTHPIKNFEIGTKGYFNRTNVTKNISKNSLFIDSYLRYSFRPFDIEISAKNLTDTKIYGYTYIKDSDIYNYSFHLRPLEFLISLRYSF